MCLFENPLLADIGLIHIQMDFTLISYSSTHSPTFEISPGNRKRASFQIVSSPLTNESMCDISSLCTCWCWIYFWQMAGCMVVIMLFWLLIISALRNNSLCIHTAYKNGGFLNQCHLELQAHPTMQCCYTACISSLSLSEVPSVDIDFWILWIAGLIWRKKILLDSLFRRRSCVSKFIYHSNVHSVLSKQLHSHINISYFSICITWHM